MVLLCVTALLLIVNCGAAADWSVIEAGALGDGNADCTAAFQKALDDAGKAGGGVVNVPAGHYRINGTISIPAGVTLQGTYRAVPLARREDAEKMPGTVLLAYAGRGSNVGEPFIRLKGSSSAVAGLIVTYPEWKITDVPPIPYPPCILSEDTENVAIIDCAIMNPYEAIRLVRAHRHLIRNFQGYPIWRGIYVDQCYDIGRIENVHIWPFGVAGRPDADSYCKWINLNGTAFEFARTDWEYVTNTFCFGYGVGYKFSQTPSGSCNGSFVSIGADSCERAVLVEQCQEPGLLITNGEFVGRWGSPSAVTMEIDQKCTGVVNLTNCAFWGPIDKCVWMRAPKGRFTASACNFLHWNVKNSGAPAVLIDAGRAVIQGNTFGNGELHVRVGKNAISAIVMGNQTPGGLVVDNLAGARAQMIGNEGESVTLTNQQKAHYKLDIGADGDERRVRMWNGKEQAAEWPDNGAKRWSAPGSKLILPVQPNKAYGIEVDVYVPGYALEPGAGVYLGKKKIVGFEKAGIMVLHGLVPASKTDTVVLDVRCKAWVPKDVIKGSMDTRQLGVALRSVVMKAQGAKEKLSNANTGKRE